MRSFKTEALVALAAWAVTAECSQARTRSDSDMTALANKLSSQARIYLPGTSGFNETSERWSVLGAPQVNISVSVGTEDDVVEVVKFANEYNLPFLAFNGVHGSITTLGRMSYGIEIYLGQLSSVSIASDNKTATIGGGTQSKVVTDTLWAAGKQTVTGTCECVSYLGPALGGGHGWLQGRHGLIADQFVSMRVVLANGTLVTVDSSSELFWAMRGAGHNFGIVTSVTSKIYELTRPDWAIETLMFTGDKVEAVYEAANEYLLRNGTQPVDVINWSYWMRIDGFDAPVIAMYIMQEGVTAVDEAYTAPFRALDPFSTEPVAGTYLDLGAWTGISVDGAPCLKQGLANPRFPIYLEAYDPTAQRQVYEVFTNITAGDSPFAGSLFMFEGYSTQGVKSVDAATGAYAFRGDNLLIAPLLQYQRDGAALDAQAAVYGNQIRDLLRQGSGRDELHTYVNYAYGDESTAQWYGYEQWRQTKLKTLKEKYDPSGRFSFYAPVA